jgi:NADPH-dependent 7-cyano-7-deazaguanine reductase QueF
MSAETNIKNPRARISVTNEITNKLTEEFGVTPTYVRVCLKFHSDSGVSVKMRLRATELMEETNKNNRLLVKEYDQD